MSGTELPQLLLSLGAPDCAGTRGRLVLAHQLLVMLEAEGAQGRAGWLSSQGRHQGTRFQCGIFSVWQRVFTIIIIVVIIIHTVIENPRLFRLGKT